MNAKYAVTPPPWVAMMQAHADQAEQRLNARAVSRDIVNSVVDDYYGPRPQSHRATDEEVAR